MEKNNIIDEYSRNLSNLKIIKKFPSFIMGRCNCNDRDCDEEFPIRNSTGYIKRFIVGHNNKGIGNSRYRGYKNSSHEYIQLNMPWHPNADIHGYVYGHVLTMSRHLKRPLEKGEVIHHLDGNTQNNDISNLQLMPNQSEHRKQHRELFYGDRRCSNCGSDKTQIDKHGHIGWYNDGKGGFICRHCYGKKNYKYIKKKDRK